MNDVAMNDAHFRIDERELQGNVLSHYGAACCARAVFLHFRTPASARAFAQAAHTRCFHGQPRALFNVAFSHAGLQLLGCSAVAREFPDAFRNGMASRAQQLGDPAGSNALRPPWLPAAPAGAAPVAWQPGSLHALATVYLSTDDVSDPLLDLLERLGNACQAQRVQREVMEEVAHAITPALDGAWAKLDLPEHDIDVLGAQDLHHPLIRQHGLRVPVEYFGFRDGISQPLLHDVYGRLDPKAVQQFVRGDDHPLLHKSSFLVLRQLEQDPGRFWSQLGGSRALAEQIVGRAMDGSELQGAPAGCPFHSHVRRLNPGIDPGANPKLLRRGMSYTHEGTCGLMFMALNADIEGQFEFIQRNWLQRGNHVGLLSAHRDPLAGLSAPGATKTQFTALDGNGQHSVVALDSCVSLKWGEYFFLPGHDALKRLAGVVDAPDVAAFLPAKPDPAREDALTARWLDNARTAGELWRYVRAQGGVQRIGTRVFVANADVLDALCPAGGKSALTVAQYRERMATSTGPFMLGMDADEATYQHEHPAVRVIPTSDPQLAQVIGVARAAAHGVCEAKVAQTVPGAAVVVELRELLAVVLSYVLGGVFGLPGPSLASLLTWSNDIARMNFRVAPSAADRAKAHIAAADFRAYVARSIAEARTKIAEGAVPDDSALRRLIAAVDAIKLVLARDPTKPNPDAVEQARVAAAAELASDADAARILLGVATGSLTAVATLFAEAFVPYAMTHQAAGVLTWPARPEPAPMFWLYDLVISATACKQARGGPDVVVRKYRGEAKTLNGVPLTPGDDVVVWLGGAAEERGDDYLFGMNDGHRCPGWGMGKAILQGLLQAMTERPGLAWKGDSVTFPPPPPPPPPAPAAHA